MRVAATFGRALLIVTLTAANVGFIARRQWAAMFASGFALSWVWWTNTRTANRCEGRIYQASYALGAGAGTLLGCWLSSLLH